jgi:amino acid adenylation domain-containing protein
MAYLLHQLLSESAEKYPDKAALFFKDQAITYIELEKESNKLANCISATGIKRGDRVGIHLNRSIESVAGALGILKAGATYVPIDPMCPKSRLSYIINKCGVKYLLTSQDKLTNIERVFPEKSTLESIFIVNGLDSGLRSLKFIKLINWQEIREDASEEAPKICTIDSDLAYILFTSGSTGNPKGVMLSHLNSLTFINTAYNFFQITKNDRFSNICPLHFDMSIFDLFVAFKAGATVAIIPEALSIFPAKLAEFIEKNRISVWNSVPSALSLLANLTNLDKYDFTSLRLILFAGEVFPVKYLRRLMKTAPEARFYNLYGQTEANTSTYYHVEQIPTDDTAILPIGRPLPNFEIFAIDEGGRKIRKPEEKGELYVRASSVALGYWADIEKTGECFVRNPISPDLNERVYKTGDIVRLDSDGNYVFLGRKDHMIKSRGYRIEIGEIETVLCNHPDIKNAIIIPIPDDLIGNRISAIIVPTSPGNLKKEDILKYCSKYLPKYMIPEIIELRESLPSTSSGKVDRKKLAEKLKKNINSVGMREGVGTADSCQPSNTA